VIALYSATKYSLLDCNISEKCADNISIVNKVVSMLMLKPAVVYLVAVSSILKVQAHVYEKHLRIRENLRVTQNQDDQSLPWMTKNLYTNC
jgi:hypothetical protein